jgi:hypothetical protein
MAKAHERVVATPLLAIAQVRALDAPKRPLGGRFASSDTNTRLLHLIGKSVQHAHRDHPVGAAIQAGVHHRRDLMAAIKHSGVRKHQHTTSLERRREIPLAGLLKPLERATLAHRIVLGAVKRVEIALERWSIKWHGDS